MRYFLPPHLLLLLYLQFFLRVGKLVYARIHIFVTVWFETTVHFFVSVVLLFPLFSYFDFPLYAQNVHGRGLLFIFAWKWVSRCLESNVVAYVHKCFVFVHDYKSSIRYDFHRFVWQFNWFYCCSSDDVVFYFDRVFIVCFNVNCWFFATMVKKALFL